MSNEYNSKLISRLYQATEDEIITRILREMAEIGDPIFIYPIFANWKKFNALNSSLSHYCISTLNNIDSDETLKISIEIIKLSTSLKDIMWTYPILTKYNYFENKFINISIDIIKRFSENKITEFIADFNFRELLSYLKNAKKIDSVSNYLRHIFLDENKEYDYRRIALFYLLRTNSVREITFFIENYNEIKSDDVDILLTKDLLDWKGNLVNKMLGILKVDGNDRSKELIFKSEKQKKETVRKEIKAEIDKFNNIQLIVEISQLRTKINTTCISNKKIGFSIFEESELLINQQEAITTYESLQSKCIDLRNIFKGISNKVINPFTNKEVSKILPDQDLIDYNKPLNRLFLFFHNKNITIDSDLVGLRIINRAVNLFTHSEEKAKLIKVLNELNLFELYSTDKWFELHREILNKYKASLEKLLRIINSNNS